MSETTSTRVLPAGVSITTTKAVGDETYHIVTFGVPPRTMSVVDLDMGAQFDLAEITGGTDNFEFRNLAFVAASVRDIDGVPLPNRGGMMSKASLRNTLKQLGREGVTAATAVINSFDTSGSTASTPDALKAAAGNS